MRRMRDWRYWLLGLSVVALIFGIQHAIKNRKGSGKDLASVHGMKTEVKPEKTTQDRTPVKEVARSEDRAPSSVTQVPEPRSALAELPKSLPTVLKSETKESPRKLSHQGFCRYPEYAGVPYESSDVSDKEWATVVSTFYSAKGRLLDWLHQHREDFSQKQVDILGTSIESMRLERPPYSDEPDLSWRGIAISGMDEAGKPYIRVGNGFVTFSKKHPKRALFELTRVIAQSWTDCDVQEEGPWNPLMACMSLKEKGGCEKGSFSEARWAVSTLIGYAVTKPSCRIPLITKEIEQSCIQKMPLPMNVTSHRAPASSTSLGEKK